MLSVLLWDMSSVLQVTSCSLVLGLKKIKKNFFFFQKAINFIVCATFWMHHMSVGPREAIWLAGRESSDER